MKSSSLGDTAIIFKKKKALSLIHGNGNCQLKVFSTSLANTLSCSAYVLVQLECCGFFYIKFLFSSAYIILLFLKTCSIPFILKC